jgi:hypothetical protein
MTLIHVDIEPTLIALGLSLRAPHHAPARYVGVFGFCEDDSLAQQWTDGTTTDTVLDHN